MDSALEVRLQELLDREDIRDTIYSYAQAVDRGDRKTCASLFTRDAVLHIGVYDGPASTLFSGPGSETLVTTHHVLGNIRIKLSGNSARAITYITAIHRNRRGKRFSNHLFRARYLDVLVRDDGRWRIAERTSVRDWSCALPDNDASLDDPQGTRAYFGAAGPDDPGFGFLD